MALFQLGKVVSIRYLEKISGFIFYVPVYNFHILVCRCTINFKEVLYLVFSFCLYVSHLLLRAA